MFFVFVCVNRICHLSKNFVFLKFTYLSLTTMSYRGERKRRHSCSDHGDDLSPHQPPLSSLPQRSIGGGGGGASSSASSSPEWNRSASNGGHRRDHHLSSPNVDRNGGGGHGHHHHQHHHHHHQRHRSPSPRSPRSPRSPPPPSLSSSSKIPPMSSSSSRRARSSSYDPIKVGYPPKQRQRSTSPPFSSSRQFDDHDRPHDRALVRAINVRIYFVFFLFFSI